MIHMNFGQGRVGYLRSHQGGGAGVRNFRKQKCLLYSIKLIAQCYYQCLNEFTLGFPARRKPCTLHSHEHGTTAVGCRDGCSRQYIIIAIGWACPRSDQREKKDQLKQKISNAQEEAHCNAGAKSKFGFFVFRLRKIPSYEQTIITYGNRTININLLTRLACGNLETGKKFSSFLDCIYEDTFQLVNSRQHKHVD